MNKLLDRPGFAIFTQNPDYATSTVRAYLDADPAIQHVVFVPCAKSDPFLVQSFGQTVQDAGVNFWLIFFEDYGRPENIEFVSSLPSANLLIVISDIRLMVSNRLDTRLEYLYTMHRAKKKIVIDTIPYYVQPWRIFFPFGVFDRSLLSYNHSYAIEQDYDKFLDGMSDHNPCDPALLAERTHPATFIDYRHYFTRPLSVAVLEASRAHHAEYAALRDNLFESEKSITGVKSKLDKWIQERYPDRQIPLDLKRVYHPLFDRIVRTDLRFDCWLHQEIDGLIRHTNTLTELYYEQNL